MPREYVHWEIFEGIRAALNAAPETAPLGEVLTKYRALSYLGAMGPDAPYYYRLGGTHFEEIAERLHGSSGEDTFDFLRRAGDSIAQLANEDREAATAFLIGYLTHCIVDMHFHPVIYYFTGDYYARDKTARAAARKRHRAWEVHLDVYWKGRGQALYGTKFFPLIKECASKAPVIFRILDETFSPQGGAQWRNAYWWMAFLQYCFFSRVLGAVLVTAKKLAPNFIGPYEALFLCGREVPRAEFDLPLQFKHPISGEEKTLTVWELRSRAVKEGTMMAKILMPLLRGESATSLLEGMKGRSLNGGLTGAKREDFKYFAEVFNPALE